MHKARRLTAPLLLSRCAATLLAPAGIKYERSAEFGVIPVTADWLVDTVLVGKRQCRVAHPHKGTLPAGSRPLALPQEAQRKYSCAHCCRP